MLAIREAGRRIQEVVEIIQDKYELHKGITEVLKNIQRDNFHKYAFYMFFCKKIA